MELIKKNNENNPKKYKKTVRKPPVYLKRNVPRIIEEKIPKTKRIRNRKKRKELSHVKNMSQKIVTSNVIGKQEAVKINQCPIRTSRVFDPSKRFVFSISSLNLVCTPITPNTEYEDFESNF